MLKYNFLALFSLWSLAITCQNSIYQNIKKEPISDIEKAIKIDSLLQKNLQDGDTTNLVIVSHKFANWHYNRKRTAQAIAVLSLSIKYHNQDTLGLQTKLFKMGRWQYLSKNYDQSIKFYNSVIDIDPSTYWAPLAYTEIAMNLISKGDYLLSSKYFETAEQLILERKDYNGLVDLYTKSYNAYVKIDTPKAHKKIITNLLTADSLAQHLSNKKFITKRAIGVYYAGYKTRDTIEGEKYLKQALKIALDQKDSTRINYIYNDLGRLFNINNNQKSLAYHKKAFKYITKNDTSSLITTLANLGINEVLLENYDLGIQQLKEALTIITNKGFHKSSHADQKMMLSQGVDNNNLWPIVRYIGEAYDRKNDNTSSKKDLDSAIVYYKHTDYIFDLYASKARITNSKLLWRREAAELYSRSLRAYKKAEALDDIFYFFEKNKALLLSEEENKRRLFAEKKSPAGLLKEEHRLQLKLYELEKNGIDSNDDFTSLMDTLELVQEKINVSFPFAGDTSEKNFKIKSLREVQKNLPLDEAIIEYHVSVDDGFGIFPNNNTNYGLVITKESSFLFTIQNSIEFKNMVNLLLENISQPTKNNKDLIIFNEVSHKVYSKLFPKEVRNIIKNKKLTIIPDNYLSHLPFEILIVHPEKNSSYLINDHNLVYKYSYSFHDSKGRLDRPKKKSFAAFAPINFLDEDLRTIENSIDETQNLQSYFKGNYYEREQANKQNLIQEIGKNQIIHLATHADANDSIAPWISLYDKKIYLDELSFHQNNAELVVLSACNTNRGDVLAGEGVLSLARGFFYGGAQSAVSSLWNIDDKSTSYIINEFYKNLSQSEDKSAALRKAKLSYLSTHSGSEVSPYYWSSLILIGDDSPIQIDYFPNFLWYFLAGLTFLIGIIFFMLSRKRKKLSIKNTSYSVEKTL